MGPILFCPWVGIYFFLPRTGRFGEQKKENAPRRQKGNRKFQKKKNQDGVDGINIQ